MPGNVRPTEIFTRSQRLPMGYVSTVEAAIKNFGSVDSIETESSTCTGDSDSYRLIVDNAFLFEEFHDSNIGITEIDTGKTSTSSSEWDVACEYDRREADRVRLMFAAMFALLFERLSTEASPAHLTAECQDWVSCFPHLRLLGEQILPPQENGYDFYPATDSSKIAPDSGLESESDSSEGISLTGRKLEPNTPPSTSRSATSTNSQSSSLGAKDDLIMEEVEEYQSPVADTNEGEEEIFACEGVYEDMIAVDYRLGDDDAAEHLKRYVRHRRLGLPPMTPSAAIRDTVCNTIFDILWAESVSVTRPLVIRMIHGPKKNESDIELPQISPSDLGVLTTVQRESGFPKIARPASVTNDSKTLSGLLHITTKTLQYRERSYLQDIPESPPIDRRVIAESRPPPSSMRASVAEPRVASAARRSRGRLAPLDRTRASQMEEEGGFGLRGHRLQTPGAASEALTRSGTLPPLSMSLLMKSGTSQRINSAAAGRNQPAPASRPVHHSLASGLGGELRPSTTHTFHSSSIGLKPLGSLLNLGIHGSSIGTSQMPAQSSAVEEEEEKRTRVPWGPVYPASLYPVHQVLRRGKTTAAVHNNIVR